MAHEVFNTDYWVAVAAAGPVLALANTVTLTNYSRNYLEYLEARAAREAEYTGERRPLNLDRASRGLRFAYVNFWVQVFVLAIALVSLQERTPLVSPWITTAVISLSLGMVATIALAVGEHRKETYLLTVKRAPILDLDADADEADYLSETSSAPGNQDAESTPQESP
jgi:hypothetical protein